MKKTYETLDMNGKQELLLLLQATHSTPDPTTQNVFLSSPISTRLRNEENEFKGSRSLFRQRADSRSGSLKRRRVSQAEEKTDETGAAPLGGVGDSSVKNAQKQNPKTRFNPIDQPVIIEGIKPEFLENAVVLMKKVKSIWKDVKIKEARRTRSNDLLIITENPIDSNKLMGVWEDKSLGSVVGRFPKQQVIMHQVIVTNVHGDITDEDIVAELDSQGIKTKKVKRIISSATNMKTKLVRVTLENEDDK